VPTLIYPSMDGVGMGCNPLGMNPMRLGVIDGYAYWDGLDDSIKTPSGEKVVVLKGDNALAEALTQLKREGLRALPVVMGFLFEK